MSIDLSSPVIRIAAIAAAAVTATTAIGYGIYKGVQYRKMQKKMSEVQAKVDEASKVVNEQKTSETESK